jgi:hypothetical protein
MKSRIPATLTSTEITGLLGFSRQRLAQLVDAKIIRRKGNDAYETASVADYVEHLRAMTDGSAAPDRAELIRERVLMARFERETAQGRWVLKDEVEGAWLRLVAVFRQRMLGLPSKIADRVFAAKSAVGVFELLRQEIREALKELAAYEHKLSDFERAENDDENQVAPRDASDADQNTQQSDPLPRA